jgi:hypothetical protein
MGIKENKSDRSKRPQWNWMSRSKPLQPDDKNPLATILNLIEEAKMSPPIQTQMKKGRQKLNAIYRGEAKDYGNSKLLPKIFRSPYSMQWEENFLIDEFQRRYPKHDYNCTSISVWLNLMQHNGLPTRLLDWSENLLVALFFAVSDESEDDGYLYILLYPQTNYISDNKLYTPTQNNHPLLGGFGKIVGDVKEQIMSSSSSQIILQANNTYVSNFRLNDLIYKPRLFHDRCKHQQSVFTIHYGKFLEGKEIVSPHLHLFSGKQFESVINNLYQHSDIFRPNIDYDTLLQARDAFKIHLDTLNDTKFPTIMLCRVLSYDYTNSTSHPAIPKKENRYCLFFAFSKTDPLAHRHTSLTGSFASDRLEWQIGNKIHEFPLILKSLQSSNMMFKTLFLKDLVDYFKSKSEDFDLGMGDDLYCIKIPSVLKPCIRNSLKICGVQKSSLFPEESYMMESLENGQ